MIRYWFLDLQLLHYLLELMVQPSFTITHFPLCHVLPWCAKILRMSNKGTI